MAKRTCDVTGIKTNTNNFYKNQSHMKAVDNFRRNTNVTKEQLTRMFNQINNYYWQVLLKQVLT